MCCTKKRSWDWWMTSQEALVSSGFCFGYVCNLCKNNTWGLNSPLKKWDFVYSTRKEGLWGQCSGIKYSVTHFGGLGDSVLSKCWVVAKSTSFPACRHKNYLVALTGFNLLQEWLPRARLYSKDNNAFPSDLFVHTYIQTKPFRLPSDCGLINAFACDCLWTEMTYFDSAVVLQGQ